MIPCVLRFAKHNIRRVQPLKTDTHYNDASLFAGVKAELDFTEV